MDKPEREELETRWQELWAQGEELKKRQEMLLGSAAEMEPKVLERVRAQLASDRDLHEAELLELRRRMKEHGGFE